MNLQTKPPLIPPPAPELLKRFIDIVGQKYAVTDRDLQEPYLVEMRDLFHGTTPVVLRPGSVEEVSAILKLANETKTAIVPQGGNTGLVGGQIPHRGEIILSLTRLNKIREIDTVSNTMTVEAGVTLQNARAAASDADRLYPQLLPSEGTCTIGGNLSTNAGGRGGYEIFADMKIDPNNTIPQFKGHPAGGPPKSQFKPTPWIQPRKEPGSSDEQFDLHVRNFIDCIKTRQRPIADVEDGHRVAVACHLANLSLRTGRKLHWDWEKEQIIGDAEANKMLVRPYRKPWDGVLRSFNL